MSRVITVKGPIPPNELGVTMCHTHILSSLMFAFCPHEEASKAALAEALVSLDNLGAIRREILSVKDNLIHDDIDVAIKEVNRFKMMGGNSLVEVTPEGIKKDPIGLFKISNATGLNIMCSTGWYRATTYPPIVAQSSQDELCNIMVTELTKGIGKTGIRAGVIKVGMGYGAGPFAHGDEEKVFRAAIRAQAITGATLTIHPASPYDEKHWHTYLDIIEQGGGT